MNKKKIEGFVARSFVLAIVITILANTYLFTTMTREVNEGDQIILLFWLEGDNSIAILGWEETHLVLFEANQWSFYGNTLYGKLHILHRPIRETPYQYFHPKSSFPTNFKPWTAGTFFFRNEAYSHYFKKVKITPYQEVDGSLSVYGILVWKPTDEEILINSYAQQLVGNIPFTDSMWDPRMDCLMLWYYHEDVGLGTMEYNEIDFYCSGNLGWPHGHE